MDRTYSPLVCALVFLIGASDTFAVSATENISLLPELLAITADRPIRLFPLEAFAIPAQPGIAALVQTKGLIVAACVASSRKPKPRFPWP